jgi:hypothetical protein
MMVSSRSCLSPVIAIVSLLVSKINMRVKTLDSVLTYTDGNVSSEFVIEGVLKATKKSKFKN